MSRHRCPGRCGKSLPIWLDICRECARRDADVITLTAGARRPSLCLSCGHAVAPGLTASGGHLCSNCEGKS